jgi:hypothetical protein
MDLTAGHTEITDYWKNLGSMITQGVNSIQNISMPSISGLPS